MFSCVDDQVVSANALEYTKWRIMKLLKKFLQCDQVACHHRELEIYVKKSLLVLLSKINNYN